MNYLQVIKELQDAVTVMDSLERWQSAMGRAHGQRMRDHDSHLAEIAEYRRRTEQNLAEIRDGLKRLAA